MYFRPMLNPLTILIYILIVFVIYTDCSWEFDNDDGFWGAPQPHSQGNTNLDYSGLFNTQDTGASSRLSDTAEPIESTRPSNAARSIELARPSDAAGPIESTKPPEAARPIESTRLSDAVRFSESLSLNSTLEEIEAVFSKIYEKNTNWPWIHNNVHEEFIKTCYAAWNKTHTYYSCIALPYFSSKHVDKNALRVVLKGKPLLCIDLLKCKCIPSGFPKLQIGAVPSLYLAGYNDSTVFLLTTHGHVSGHKLKIRGMKKLKNL